MDELEYGHIADFIGENWAQFLDFMILRNVDELRCEDLLRELGNKAGRP